MEEEKRKSKGKIVTIVILVILLIGSLSYIAYDLYFYKYFKKEVKVEEKKKETKKDEVKEVEMDIDDSKTIDRLKMIIPHDDSGKDAYQSKKVTYKDISNKVILGSVGKFLYNNQNDYKPDGVYGQAKSQNECLDTLNHGSCYKKTNDLNSGDNMDGYYWTAYKKETIADIVKESFGDINYTDETIEIYKNLGICNFKDNIYFCTYGGGDTGCIDVYKEGEFTKATKKGDEIYLYEKYILYTSTEVDKNGDLYCKTNIYKYGDKTNILVENKEYNYDAFSTWDENTQKEIKSKVFEDYEKDGTVYKHTFKDDGTGNYIWVSTEPTN